MTEFESKSRRASLSAAVLQESMPVELLDIVIHEGGYHKGTTADNLLRSLFSQFKEQLWCENHTEGENLSIKGAFTSWSNQGYAGKNRNAAQVACKVCKAKKGWNTGGSMSIAHQLVNKAKENGISIPYLLEGVELQTQGGQSGSSEMHSSCSEGAHSGQTTPGFPVVGVTAGCTPTLTGGAENFFSLAHTNTMEAGSSWADMSDDTQQWDEMVIDVREADNSGEMPEGKRQRRNSTVEKGKGGDPPLTTSGEPNLNGENRKKLEPSGLRKENKEEVKVDAPSAKTGLKWDDLTLLEKGRVNVAIEKFKKIGLAEEEATNRALRNFSRIKQRKEEQKAVKAKAKRHVSGETYTPEKNQIEKVKPIFIKGGTLAKLPVGGIRKTLAEGLNIKRNKIFNVERMPSGWVEIMIPENYEGQLRQQLSGKEGFQVWTQQPGIASQPEHLQGGFNRDTKIWRENLEKEYELLKQRRTKSLQYTGNQQGTIVCIQEQLDRLEKEYKAAQYDIDQEELELSAEEL